VSGICYLPSLAKFYYIVLVTKIQFVTSVNYTRVKLFLRNCIIVKTTNLNIIILGK